MTHRTGGGRHRPLGPWPATVEQAGGSMGAAKHRGEASMNRSSWASAALAKCTLEIDSLAYRGLPAATADGHAGKDLGTPPTPAGGPGAVRG
jgi:hypothetical protein